MCFQVSGVLQDTIFVDLGRLGVGGVSGFGSVLPLFLLSWLEFSPPPFLRYMMVQLEERVGTTPEEKCGDAYMQHPNIDIPCVQHCRSAPCRFGPAGQSPLSVVHRGP